MAIRRSRRRHAGDVAAGDEDRAGGHLSSPAIIRSSVDLPQPEGPSSAQNSPASTARLRSRITSTAPKRLLAGRISTASTCGHRPLSSVLAQPDHHRARCAVGPEIVGQGGQGRGRCLGAVARGRGRRPQSRSSRCPRRRSCATMPSKRSRRSPPATLASRGSASCGTGGVRIVGLLDAIDERPAPQRDAADIHRGPSGWAIDALGRHRQVERRRRRPAPSRRVMSR